MSISDGIVMRALAFYRAKTGVSTEFLEILLDVPDLGARGDFSPPNVIRISSQVPFGDVPMVLFHELAHYEQYVSGRLRLVKRISKAVLNQTRFDDTLDYEKVPLHHDTDETVWVYQGRPVDELPYHRRPVEVDARKRCYELLLAFDRALAAGAA